MSDADHIAGGDEDGFLVAEYALGLLTGAEHDRVRSRLRSEPALRADLRFWRTRLSSLDSEFIETTAPAGVWPALEKRLFSDRAAVSGAGGFWNSLAFWRALSGAAVAIAIVAIAVNVATPRLDPNAFAAQLVAALSAQGSNVQVVALYSADTGQIRITPIAGDAVPGKDYELWAIEGQQPAKSLGVIPITASKDVTIKPDILAGFGTGTTLAITLEQTGGSPTGKAQGPIVAAGKATPI